MITQEALQELLAFDAGGSEVVSIYLNADTSQRTNETIKLEVRSMFKDVEGKSEDLEAILNYLDYSHDWGVPGLAMFSCADKELFQAFSSAVAFRNRFRISGKPYVKPLTHLLEYYAHYGVVVVDRVGAKFFEYHLGELQEASGFMGEDIRKLKIGGGSSRGGGMTTTTGQRGGQGGKHEEETAMRNLREAADAAQSFFARRPIRRLFVGGTSENVAQFRDLLSKQLQSRVAGTFSIDMNAGEREVREITLNLLREANMARENKLVRTMITTAAKGGNAVLGVDTTLKMIGEGRVHTLVISDGLRMPGFILPQTGFLATRENEMPSLDQEQTVPVSDVIEEAVHRTMEQGGSVEVISENSELEVAGRIGAMLRY